MPGKDERDPLDDWLEREIRPLAPPPGTFTMITKRARRRKLGKLAITVASAATVAAAAVIAVPTVLALHIGQPSSTGIPVSVGSTPVTSTASRGGSSEETSTASPGTPSSAGQATSTPDPYPTGGAVPPNFQPTSVTFIGPHVGWAIGQGGPPCATQYCTSMVLTKDGGQTWRGVPAPETNGVTSVRFLNGQDGWAYGPQLWSTHDYGRTWTQVNTGGADVIDLETAGDQAFAVFATCSATTPAASITLFGEHCTDFQLESTQAGADNWSPITFSGASGSGSTLTMSGPSPQVVTVPTISLTSSKGWLVGPLGQVYSGSLTAGTWQQLSVSPCGANSAPTPASAMLGWVLQTGKLIWACNAQGTGATTVYASADGGSTWTKQATAPSFGEATGLAASAAAPYILATTKGIEDFNINAAQWQQTVSLAGGFTYIGMTTNEQGVAIPANASLHEVWLTGDGGMNWTPYQIK